MRALWVCALLLLSACGSGGSAMDAGSKPTCEMIVSACHDRDPGSGPIHECHEFAEAAATTETQCMMRLNECRTTCGGGSGDGGTTDASASGG